MKIKPIVKDYIQTRHTSFKVNLMLETNITFITGESGSGKTTLYSILLEYAADDNSIRCFNYKSDGTISVEDKENADNLKSFK